MIRVPAEVTFPLRQAVLRPHQQVEELAAADDGAPDTGTFAVFDDVGEIVASGTVSRRPPPFPVEPEQPGWQIRGMAVAPGRQGQGLGSAVLDALLRHIADHGGGRAWCNARIPARGVYAKAGFEPVGEAFEIDHIGPHVVMTRLVSIG